MSDKRVLYQIKTLEKMILRNFLSEERVLGKESKQRLTPTQMQILEYILEHSKQDIYQKDLERILNLRRATVSGVLQTMEKNMLIERVTNSEDTRAKKIILHEKAKEIFAKNFKKIEEIENIITNNISKKDLNTFFEVIEAMKENIKKKNTTKYISKE